MRSRQKMRSICSTNSSACPNDVSYRLRSVEIVAEIAGAASFKDRAVLSGLAIKAAKLVKVILAGVCFHPSSFGWYPVA